MDVNKKQTNRQNTRDIGQNAEDINFKTHSLILNIKTEKTTVMSIFRTIYLIKGHRSSDERSPLIKNDKSTEL